MLPYLLPVIYAVACILIFDVRKTNIRWRNTAYWLLCAYVVLLFGLRDGIGYDTVHLYAPRYEEYPDWNTYEPGALDKYSYFSPLFRWMFFLFKSLGAPFWLVQLFIAMFINISVFAFIRRHQRHIFMPVLLYLLCTTVTYNFNILRQGMAFAVFLWSYDYLIRRQWIKYYACAVIAFLFHTSAVIFLFVPFLFVLSIRLNKKLLPWWFVSCAVMLLVYIFIRPVASFFGETYGDKIMKYMFVIGQGMNVNYYIYYLGILLIIPLCLTLYYKYARKDKVKYEPLICALIILAPGVVPFHLMIYRLAYYFIPFFLFATGECMECDLEMKNVWRKVMVWATVLALAVCYNYVHYKNYLPPNSVVPYRCIIEVV